MRRMFWLLAALILFAAGCATTAPEVVETVPEEEAPVVVEEKAPETEIIKVYLPVSEVLVSSDGVVDGFVEYDYDDMGNLLEKRELDSERKLVTRMENQVSGGRIVRTQWFRGENNEPGIYLVKNYEEDNLVEEISFDIKDVPQSISNYEYDGMGHVVKWIVSSGDNVPMMVTEYEYDGDNRVKAIFLTPLGEMEGYIDYLWEGDLLVKEITNDNDGKVENSIEYMYDGDRLVGEVHYRKTVVSHKIEYELDETGNAAVKKHFYRSGNLKAQWEYEYISVEKEVRL